ncbi:hypothetical protein EJ04DRAFT_452474, partial [Polyplosphaeria fusca]
MASTSPIDHYESIRQAQGEDGRVEDRADRYNFIAHCIRSSAKASELNDQPLMLRNGKIYIDTDLLQEDGASHICSGYYAPYPDGSYEGLVTTINDAATTMNWVYVEINTNELRCGDRKDADRNLAGPFDRTRETRHLTFQEWEGFCAVEETPGIWAVYFDTDDNALKDKVPLGTIILEIEIELQEKRYEMDAQAATQTQT